MPDFRRGAETAKRAAKPEPDHTIGGVFEAQYPGVCRAPACDMDIEPGDVIQYVEDETWHQDCVIDEQQSGGVLA